MRVYGNLTNRLEEGRNFTEDKQIHVGDDITMYSYSDRDCYFVTKVIDQKHIFVKQYYICADQEKAGGIGHQEWLYFKTHKEMNDYLEKSFPGQNRCDNDNLEEEWEFRNNRWKKVYTYDQEKLQKRLNEIKLENEGISESICLDKALRSITNNDKEYGKLKAGKTIKHYYTIDKVSFGIRDYYYDWSF